MVHPLDLIREGIIRREKSIQDTIGLFLEGVCFRVRITFITLFFLAN